MLFVGLMSGTSMDGVDVALIETDGEHHINTLAGSSIPYPPDFHHLLKFAEEIAHDLSGDLILLEKQFTEILRKLIDSTAYLEIESFFIETFQMPLNFKNLVKASAHYHILATQILLHQAKISPEKITAIGYHGQTLFHDPGRRITLQVADADQLAQTLRCPIIYDFRSQDVALGGQGAPLAPIYHRALVLRDRLCPAAVVNIGGVANVSLVTSHDLDDMIGFDTGPGNALVDQYLKKISHGKLLMDKDGEISARGKRIEPIFQAVFSAPKALHYRDIKGAKSLDVNDFTLPDMVFDPSYSREDVAYTLLDVTASLIIEAISNKAIKDIILCGGGAHNPTLVKLIQAKTAAEVKLAADIPWHNDTLEAELMAYLAARRLKNLPTSLPNITGVPMAISGGRMCEALG